MEASSLLHLQHERLIFNVVDFLSIEHASKRDTVSCGIVRNGRVVASTSVAMMRPTSTTVMRGLASASAAARAAAEFYADGLAPAPYRNHQTDFPAMRYIV